MSIRNRKYCYIYENYSPEIYKKFKNIDCKYHAISFENNAMYGFIYFNYTSTESAVQRRIKYDKIFHTDKNPLEIRNELLKKENFWEDGTIPRQCREKTVDMSILCNFIMKQHEQLIQNMLNDKNQIMEKNNQLMENNNQLIESNIKLIEDKDGLQKSLIEKITIPQNTMTYSANSNNSSTDNSKNKKITNINVFLNTECKDAITMKDFINDLVIEDEDLMYLKQYGYIESVARLLNKALSNYDIYKRPIHCTDTKREVMHVKDQEGWKKEDPSGQSKNLDSAFTKLSQMQNRKMMSYYKGIDIDSPNIEEMAFVMKRISEVCGSEDAGKKKIIKKIIENIRL